MRSFRATWRGCTGRPRTALHARPHTASSSKISHGPVSPGTEGAQGEDATVGSLDEGDIVNYDMAADIIISSLEEHAMGDVPMAMPRDAQPKPLPPAQPPQMPSRTDPGRLLAYDEASSASRGIGRNEDQDTLAISADVQWQQGSVSERGSVDSETQGDGLQQLGQQAEAEAHGRSSHALTLLRQRQQQDFRAKHAVDESDGKTTEERIQAARAKAAKAAAEQTRRQQEYAQVAAREAARQKRLREEARQEYEAAEARRAEDMAKRVAVEQEISRQRADERRKSEKALRKSQEEAARKAAVEGEEQRLREEAAEKAAEKAAVEERAALQKQRHMFVMRTAGRVAASKARPGMFTDGPVTLPAKVEMAAEVSNVLVGELGPVTRGAATLDDAQDLTISVGGEVSTLFRQANTEAFMTQHVMGKGPLTQMDGVEVRHWMNQACMAVQAAATAALRTSIDQLEENGLKAPATDIFSLKFERGVLPRGHDRRADATLIQRILDVQGKASAAEERFSACLDNLSEEEAPWVWPALQQSSTKVFGCEHVVNVCLAAHVLDRAQDMQTSENTEAGQWDNTLVDLVCTWLTARLQSAPPDGLLDVAEMACWTVGDDHPIAKHVLTLANSNMSSARKQAVVERQRALDSLMAEQLLEQERRSARELSDEQALEKQELTPVPERVWALRNIAATMALGDRRSREKARELYGKALELQRRSLGGEKHPGLLGEVWRLAELLQQEDDWQSEASVLWEESLTILEAVIVRYRGQGDLVSATALAEGTCAALEIMLGPSHAGIRRIIMSADNMFSALDETEQEQVIVWRGSSAAVDTLIKNFTQALRPYEVLTGNKNLQLWDSGHIDPLIS